MFTRGPRGLSLFEVLIALGLLSALLALSFSFLVPTLRVASRGETLVQMQQEATVALQKICDDLAQSSVGGVSLNSNVYAYNMANACPTLPLTPPTPPIVFSVEALGQVCSTNNAQIWNTSYLSVYDWNSGGELNRRLFAAGQCGTSIPTHPADLPGQVTPCQLCSLGVNQALHSELLATGVTWFSVAYPTALSKCLTPPTIRTQDGFPATPLTITITLQRYAATGSTRPMTVTFSRSMAMRETGTAYVVIPTATPALAPSPTASP